MTPAEHLAALAEARSFLFAPGHRLERFANALASGADAAVLLDGRMIDLPVVLQARATLARSARQ